jgi:hypothetical protein
MPIGGEANGVVHMSGSPTAGHDEAEVGVRLSGIASPNGGRSEAIEGVRTSSSGSSLVPIPVLPVAAVVDALVVTLDRAVVDASPVVHALAAPLALAALQDHLVKAWPRQPLQQVATTPWLRLPVAVRFVVLNL